MGLIIVLYSVIWIRSFFGEIRVPTLLEPNRFPFNSCSLFSWLVGDVIYPLY